MAVASVHWEGFSREALRGLNDEVARAQAGAAQHAAVARLSHAALAGAAVADLMHDAVQAIAGCVPGSEVAVVAAADGGDDAFSIPLDEGHVLVVRTPAPLEEDERAFVESVATVLVAATAREQARRYEALAAAGQLAAGVAHDVTNIVTVIKLYAQLLESESELDGQAKERLHIIRTQAERAVSLGWQVMEAAQRQPLELADVDLVPFVNEFGRVIGGLLPAGVVLIVESDGPSHVVRADVTRLQQVLTNLAANAGQALTGGGGTLAIRVAADGAGWARIDVADTGDGIPADVLPRVFEPFFSTKPAGKGSGLGLPQVQALVAQHGGHVTIRSVPREGTVVSVWLPEVEGAGAPLQDAEGPAGQTAGTGQLVLVVEDDPVLRAALVDVLGSLGYRSEVVGDGDDALAWLHRPGAHADAVLSDVAMAGLGGEGLARRMAVSWPEVPVILTTSAPGDGTVAGAVFRLAKPFSIEQLARALGAALA